jgi:hypothetical protein
MQALMLQLFHYGPPGASLENLLNTGTSRTEKVSNALKNAFNDPTEFLNKVEKKIIAAISSNVMP